MVDYKLEAKATEGGTAEVITKDSEVSRITELTFKIPEKAFKPDPEAELDTVPYFKLSIGANTYTGKTIQELESAIDPDMYVGTFDAATGLFELKLSESSTKTEIKNYKLTYVDTVYENATDLQTLAELINEEQTTNKFFASINTNGDLIILPTDDAVPPEIPEFSMVSQVVTGYEIPSTGKTKEALSYDIPYLSSEFALTLGEEVFSGTTLEGLQTDINDAANNLYNAVIQYNSDGSKTLLVTVNDETTTAIPAKSALKVDFLGMDSNPNALVFDVRVDGAAEPITIDLSYLSELAAPGKKFTGVEIAREITNAINKAYGDERYFDFTKLSEATDTQASLFRIRIVRENETIDKTIQLNKNQFDIADLRQVTVGEAINAIQAAIDKEVDFLPSAIKVGYDPVRQSFTFKSPTDESIEIRSFNESNSQLFGLSKDWVSVDESNGTWGAKVLPQGDFLVQPENRRYGIEVKFDETNLSFTISSGVTGDTSSIEISKASAFAHDLFGWTRGDTPVKVETSATPLRGIPSQPAVLQGNTIGINLDNKFRVDGSNNQFVVTVDNVTGLITIPPKADYTMEAFREELQNSINALADNFGRTVSGVTVEIDEKPGTNSKFFRFTTGTTGDESFLKVSANSIWGLDDLPAARGTTSKWIEPPQAKNTDGFPLFVDRDGLETSNPGAFSEDETRDLWSPIFLDKGEITFDTAGKLFSPQEAIAFKSTTIGDSGATLQFSIDYASSTQYSSPFSVLKQDQNGRPEGDLIGVDIGDDGLVNASYSNGSQKSLAKIVLVNFAAPTGLRQIGDASYYATSKSGDARYGEAGSAGFGTVRAGAR